MKKRNLLLSVLSVLFLSGVAMAQTASPPPKGIRLSPIPFRKLLNCDDLTSGLCVDTGSHLNYDGNYTGHDEPSLLFYSDEHGAGNNQIYLIKLPKDPPNLPTQDGKGGTYNFELRPAFWFGMAMCDSESFPNFTKTCKPDSDENIFDSSNPASPHYIGRHPGGAFLEMQFYPPGWIGSPQLIDPEFYFAALNIDSDGESATQLNNNACLESAGQETVNFAVITLDGVPLFPPNPLGANFGTSNPDLNNVLSMAPGDTLLLIMHDTPDGVQVTIKDLTTGQSGSMTAGPGQGFGQVVFDPSATTCNVTPYAFHPMYSTSSEHTRVPWTAHAYNIAFSDEIGHFEFCDASDANFNCAAAGVPDNKNGDGLDADDTFCFSPSDFGLSPPFIDVRACINEDSDFDGVSYGHNWPGTGHPSVEKDFHAQPVRFTSPLFFGRDSFFPKEYERVAFETDLPGIESYCSTKTGIGCTNPPLAGANQQATAFYPIYTTTHEDGLCFWQIGGKHIPGTDRTFGGNSAAEFSNNLLELFYPEATGPIFRFEDYRRTLKGNPCAKGNHDRDGDDDDDGRGDHDDGRGHDDGHGHDGH